MKNTQIFVAVVLGLLLAGGGFAAGMTVGKAGASPAPSASDTVGRTFTGGNGGRGNFTGGAGGAQANGQSLVTGQVLSVNDGSITIQTRQGGGAQGASPTTGSAIVLVGSSTQVVRTQETPVSLSDLKPNEQVTIVATTDSSGTLSASSIVVGTSALGGLFPGAGGRGRPSPSPSPTP